MEVRKTAELGTLGSVTCECRSFKVHLRTRLPAQDLLSPILAANLLCKVEQYMVLSELSLDLRK